MFLTANNKHLFVNKIVAKKDKNTGSKIIKNLRKLNKSDI